MFADLVTHANLLKAFDVARKGKTQKKEVQEFESNILRNTLDILKSIRRGTYEVGEYYEFTIYDPKERLIQATPFKDRVVQHMICDEFLTPLVDKVCIYDNCACRPNKGTDFARKRLRKFLQARKQNNNLGHCLQIDIRKYFDSVNHSVLKEILREKVKSEKICKLLDKFIDSFYLPVNGSMDIPEEEKSGLAMGNQTSQIFALFYLDSIDRLAKEKYRIKHYVRYMDDIIAIADDKETLKNLFEDIKKELSKLKLELNEDKTKIFKVSTGITFIGFRFKFDKKGRLKQTIKASSKGRIKSKLRKRFSEYKDKKISLSKFAETAQTYKGYLKKEKHHKLEILSDEMKKAIELCKPEWKFSLDLPSFAKIDETRINPEGYKLKIEVPGIRYEKKNICSDK